jgi:transposase
MDTTSIPPLASIGIDIGKEVFHVVGFSTDGRIAFRRKIKRLAWSRPSKSCLRASLAWRPA